MQQATAARSTCRINLQDQLEVENNGEEARKIAVARLLRPDVLRHLSVNVHRWRSPRSSSVTGSRRNGCRSLLFPTFQKTTSSTLPFSKWIIYSTTPAR